MYHANVKIHGLVSSLGRQLIGCVGTIVRVGTAEKRYGVNVDNLTIATYLMVRLLLMMIRLEMILKAPARGWGDDCLNLLRRSYFVSAEYVWTQLLVGMRLGHPRPRIHKAVGTWLPPEAGAHDYKFSH